MPRHIASSRKSPRTTCNLRSDSLPAGDVLEAVVPGKDYRGITDYCQGCAVGRAPRTNGAVDAELASFATKVLAAARVVSAARGYTDRVFVSHVFVAVSGELGLDMETFKARLVLANEKRMLSLSRADMVELMGPADVQASEVHSFGATFHFIAL